MLLVWINIRWHLNTQIVVLFVFGDNFLTPFVNISMKDILIVKSICYFDILVTLCIQLSV
jgi:hypothetical protein